MSKNISILFNEDCLKVLPKIQDKSIDLVLADPPYGTTQCKWDSIIPLEPMWKELKRVIKPNGVIVLFAQTPFDKVLGASNLDWLKYEWIWEKPNATGHLNANKMPMKAHENILVFYDRLPTYNPQKTTGHSPVHSYTKTLNSQNKTEVYGSATKEVSGGGSTERFPRSVQKFSSDKQRTKLDGTIHPTQKPLSLVEYLIKTYSNEEEIVLDFCFGSNTTGVACSNLNRDYIGIEKDAYWYGVGKNRLDKFLKN